MRTTPATVYRVYDKADTLLYVGLTTGPSRFDQLRTEQWWPAAVRIDIQHFESWEAGADAEHRAINDESPAHNRYKGHAGKKRRKQVYPMALVFARVPNLEDYIRDRRRRLAPWRTIAQEVTKAADLEIEISPESLKSWVGEQGWEVEPTA